MQPEDQWYLRAAKLRSDWRINAINSGESGSLGAEALEIIDEAIALQQDIDFYGMRMAAAYFAEDYNASVETARRMIWMMSANLTLRAESGGEPLSQREIGALVVRARSIREGLSAIREEDRVPAYKLDSLEEQIERVLRELERL